jgi:hypothetical protein
MGISNQVLDYDSTVLLKTSNDLDTITCYIDFTNLSNFSLLDKDFLLKKFQKETKDFFEDNGIKYKIEPPGDKGGGGLSSLIEIFKDLWKYKDFLAFFLSAAQYFIHIFDSFVQNNINSQKPGIEISLIIQSKRKLNQKHLEKFQKWYLSDKISNLLNIGDALCEKLCELHKYLKCDLSIRGIMAENNYMVHFQIPHEYRKNNKISRFLYLIKNLKIKENRCSDYDFTKWYAIKRTDSKFEIDENSSSIGPKFSKYYLFFSTKIIRDYF